MSTFFFGLEKKNNFGGDTSPSNSFINEGSNRDVIIYNIYNGNINNGIIKPAKEPVVNTFNNEWDNWSKWR